ncbi:Calx-beta domain-containing protein [Arcobacter defluvii]|uniref:Calx-beta domain-containing protein n=1 Tax=Arcobacter defluvii TaxID=873191 RepID=UPI00100B6B8B|nr:Calx-beta domain-containing protein [Arcobacter defluvii]RXI34527.1 hypothetical protein CP964_00065 [Arcobacter defluvii]
MKLTIKSEGQDKVVDLNKDLQFNVNKGEQYIFSNGFSSYVLNFKDNQQSVELTFKIDGKTIKVDLKGIVPLLQENVEGMENPTLVIINKTVNEKDVDNIVDNDAFNGSEIIDRLEALLSKPVELGSGNGNDKLAIISDFQSLVETLDAAAAGGEQGGATSNGSTFNSIFGSISDSLNGIADSAIWENLSESISTIPVETGNTAAIAANQADQIVNILVSDAGSVKEADGATLTYEVKLSNAVGSDVEVDLTTGGTATRGSDYENTLQYSTDGGTTWLDVPATGKVTLPADGSSILVKVTVIDDAITEPDETVLLTATTINTQITTKTATGTGTILDDRGSDNPDVDEDIKANILVSDAGSVKEADGATLTYEVKLSNAVGSDVEVDLTTGGTATRGSDYENTLQYSTDGGTTWLDVPATGKVTLPADGSSILVKVTVIDDAITEPDETVLLTATTINTQITTKTATGTGTILDDRGSDNPDVDEDVPVITITGSIVSEKESGIATGDKVIGTVSISIDKVFNEDIKITLSDGQQVTIYAGEYTPRNTIYIETDRIDDYYKQGTTTFEVSITDISNSEIDISDKKTEITINDDVDPIGMTVTATATSPKIIDVDTEFDDLTGVSIYATDTKGNNKEISVVKGTNHDGFGVYGKTTGSGASTELGNLGNGESEKIVLTFDKDVNSLDVAFAWRHNGETARVTFIKDGQILGYAEVTGGGDNTKAKVNYYSVDGELIKSVEAQGGTDRVDLSYTFELTDTNGNLVAFDQVEFTAPNYDDDYLINKISYKEVVDTSLTDIITDGGEVTFSIQLDEKYPPQGTATATIEINGITYENVAINATGRATLTVDSKDLGDLSNVVVKVISINGGNYEKVEQVEETFDFSPVLESSDDSITTNEDTSYIFKVSDFGNISVNTTEFKITELPSLQSGKLYLLVTEGETIIDKEGNLITVTQDTKIEVYEGQIISLADVGTGKLIFEPTSNSDIDGELKFEVGDGNGNYSDEYTTSIEIIAVADAPIASIDVVKIETLSTTNEIIVKVGNKTYNISEIIANKDSYTELSGITNSTSTNSSSVVINENMDSNDYLKTTNSDDIIVLNGDFGGQWGNAKFEGMSGNDVYVILGDIRGSNNAINDSAGDADIIYLSKAREYYVITDSSNHIVNNSGTGVDFTITQYDDNGNFVGSMRINNIEGIVFGDGSTFGSIEKVETTTTTINYEVDITAALVDTDGSETLTVQISGVPEGATFDLANMTNLGNGIWEVIVPQGGTSINYSNIKMTVPSEVKYVDLQITAKSTEVSNNSSAKTTDSDATIYAVNESEQVNMQEFKYNLVLTIDNSGSMKGDKIALAKAAMVNLINKYDDLGEVKVLLNVFNAYGDIKGVWVDPSKAISLINAISAGGGTNYDDALLKNITALENNPAPLDGKTISYFVSDGVPTYGMYEKTEWSWSQLKKITTWERDGDGKNTTDVNDKIVNDWKKLDIDKTYSIGIGTNELNTYMREISQNPDEDVIIISNANDLSSTLEDTVQELLVDGNVINNVVGGDGEISIDSIEVDGKEYTKDDFPEDGLLLGDNNIKFTFDFETGDYQYYAKSSNFVEEVETFKVNASDSDGDKTSFDVSASVKIVQEETSNIQNLMGEDIDLTTVITKNTDVINLENSTNDKITIELEDMLVQEDKQLIIKGDDGDMIELDNPSDWSNAGTEQLDGINYNVYTGTGENSTVKLLIEDDIDITPDI